MKVSDVDKPWMLSVVLCLRLSDHNDCIEVSRYTVDGVAINDLPEGEGKEAAMARAVAPWLLPVEARLSESNDGFWEKPPGVLKPPGVFKPAGASPQANGRHSATGDKACMLGIALGSMEPEPGICCAGAAAGMERERSRASRTGEPGGSSNSEFPPG